jgi:predicted nuclease of predicted toxin-antitoxin system
VKFLIDQNRSPRLAELLRDAGHDAVHTLELGLERAADADLIDLAALQDRVIVSGDTDFGALIALMDRRSPSVVLFRSRTTITADDQFALIRDHLDDIAPDLDAGAVVVVSDDRMRVRRLPLLHGDQGS